MNSNIFPNDIKNIIDSYIEKHPLILIEGIKTYRPTPISFKVKISYVSKDRYKYEYLDEEKTWSKENFIYTTKGIVNRMMSLFTSEVMFDEIIEVCFSFIDQDEKKQSHMINKETGFALNIDFNVDDDIDNKKFKELFYIYIVQALEEQLDMFE